MPLEEFPHLQDNTRLIRHKDTLYKVKVRYEGGTNDSVSDNFTTEEAHSQIEDTFRALLYILQRDETLKLKPIQTENFLITIIQTPWSFCNKYGFNVNGKELKGHPVQFEFRITIKQDDKQVKRAVNVETATPTKSKVSDERTDIKSKASEENTDISEVRAEVDSVPVPRFSRSNRGSLVSDGIRVISKDSGKGSVDSNVSDSAKIHATDTKDSDAKSASSRDGLKRKPRTTEVERLSELSGISKRSRISDKGLEVEQYHNRNNSSKGEIQRNLGQRLRIRKSREPFVQKRHSQRLRTKEDQRQRESSTESSESESESKEVKQSASRHVKSIAKHNNKTEISESEYSKVNKAKTENKLRSKASRTRKRMGGNVGKDNNLATETETEEDRNLSSPDKHKLTGKSKLKHITSKEDVKTASLELAQESQTKKHKLYTETRSPVLLATRQSHDKAEAVSSPRVSTVLPQKRARSKPDLLSPRPTRQQTLVRSPVEQVDLIASSRQRVATHHNVLDEEGRRIQRMQQQQAPTRSYRNILLAQGRDRHMVEQAERAETDKLRQLYEPTAVRRSPRLQEQGGNASLWQKFVGAVVTPFKNIVTGNKRRWSDVH